MLHRPSTGPRVRRATAALVASLALVLAACGSRLDPADVAATGAGVAAGGSTVPGEGSVGGTGDLGADAPAVDGGGTGGAGDPGTGAGGGDSTGGDSTQSGEVAPDAPNAPDGGGRAADCKGFENQTGITDKTITIANASDVSGPIPGLFEASQDAVRAYVAFFNATSDICGRKLSLAAYDSRTDAGADQQAYTKACEQAFAAVGSMSAFDSGGAATAAGCGLPDIRAAAVTQARAACRTCFGAQSANESLFQNAVPDFLKKTYGEAAQHAALLYINAGAAAENGPNQARAMERRGMNFDYVQGIDISEFNYAPYVQQMKDRGIRSVQWLGAASQAVRLAQAMKQQDFKPDVYLLDPTGYDPELLETGGEAVEGAVVFMNFTPFEEAASNEEVQLYLSWLRQVKPDATPSFFGLFSWSAARLFVERARALGGDLDRASLVAAFAKTDKWTANGMHAPQSVGAKTPGPCWRFITVRDGRWVPKGSRDYLCTGLTRAD